MSELLKRLQTGQRHIAEYTCPNDSGYNADA